MALDILIVESETSYADTLMEELGNALRDLNPRLQHVESAEAAWDMLQMGWPAQILITNCDLPDMSGIQLTAEIRVQKTPIKIIGMSGGNHEKRFLQMGADGFFDKKDVTVLVEKIRQILKPESPTAFPTTEPT